MFSFGFSDLTKAFTDIGSDIVDSISALGIGGSETDPLSNFTEKSEVINTSIMNSVNQLTTVANSPKMEFQPIDINEKVEVTVNVNLDPSSKDQALSDLMTKAVKEYFEGGQNKTNVTMVLDQLNNLKDKQGLLVAGSPTSPLVSKPGSPT